MRNKLFGKLIGLAAIAVVLAGVAGILTTNGSEAAGPDRVVAGVGIVPGLGLVVHVAVLVGPGQSDRAAVDTADHERRVLADGAGARRAGRWRHARGRPGSRCL